MRSGAIYGEIDGGKAMSLGISIMIASIAILIVGIMVSKVLHSQRGPIGILKSMGYKNSEITVPYIFFIMIMSFPTLILIGKDMTDKLSGRSSTLQMMFELLSPAAKENTNFLGTVPYRDIKKHIATATVCVFPSYAEALPLSWLEAMALEKAISNCIGMAFLVLIVEFLTNQIPYLRLIYLR